MCRFINGRESILDFDHRFKHLAGFETSVSNPRSHHTLRRTLLLFPLLFQVLPHYNLQPNEYLKILLPGTSQNEFYGYIQTYKRSVTPALQRNYITPPKFPFNKKALRIYLLCKYSKLAKSTTLPSPPSNEYYFRLPHFESNLSKTSSQSSPSPHHHTRASPPYNPTPSLAPQSTHPPPSLPNKPPATTH
jgi:hypothetical protein